jgi:hypothetical protein
MLLAELHTGFPWGVLLVTDAESTEQIPSWASADEQVAAAATALVVRVMHRDDGDVAVRVWSGVAGAVGDRVFSGPIAVPSRVLRVSDALGEDAVDIGIPSKRARVEIFTDDAAEASEVHLVADRLG